MYILYTIIILSSEVEWPGKEQRNESWLPSGDIIPGWKKNKQRNSSCSFYYHILSNSADRTGFIAGGHFTCVLWSDGHWSHPDGKWNHSAKLPVYLVRFNTKELNYTGSV